MAEAHVERMKTEFRELSDKIKALEIFIYSSSVYKKLPSIEKVELVKQLAFMEGYKQVLDARIWRAHHG